MKLPHLASLAVMALCAAAVQAQTSDQAPAPPPPPEPYAPAPPPEPGAPGYSAPGYPANNYGYSLAPGTELAGVVTVPYAFNWNATGISAELGALMEGNQFLGAEITYYDGESRRYNVYNGAGAYVGHFDSSLELTTLDLAYRYFMPLGGFGPHSPIAFYLGGSLGAGFATYSNSGAYFGFSSDDSAQFTGEGLAGFQFDAGPDVAVRIGYRYVGVSNAWQFDQRVNLDSSVLEAGLAFRF